MCDKAFPVYRSGFLRAILKISIYQHMGIRERRNRKPG
jgi:hypothetical protein